MVADATAAGVPVNSADGAAPGTVQLPAVHREGRVTVAVSTGGQSPALASWLRTRLSAQGGIALGELAELLGRARRSVRDAGRSTEMVDWVTLLDGPLPELVHAGRMDEARVLVEAATGVPLPV